MLSGCDNQLHHMPHSNISSSERHDSFSYNIVTNDRPCPDSFPLDRKQLQIRLIGILNTAYSSTFSPSQPSAGQYITQGQERKMTTLPRDSEQTPIPQHRNPLRPDLPRHLLLSLYTQLLKRLEQLTI